jgi:urease accessory protein
MLRLNGAIGHRDDPALADRLHALAHRGGVETLAIAPQDAGRSRLRATTDAGTDCAVTQPRGSRLQDGAVLLLEADRAIVVRVGALRWLALRPRDQAAALQLGYHAGNLHWRVRFDGQSLLVALDGPREDYLARLRELTEAGLVEIADAGR